MKRIIVIVVLFAISSSVNAQSFSVRELTNLVYKNWDDFDTYVTAKGYSYNEAKKDSFYESRIYSLHRSDYERYAGYWISFYKYLDHQTMISWQTSNQKYYLDFKAQLIAEGFKFIKSEIVKGNNVNTYVTGNKEITLVSGKTKANDGREVNVYEISLTLKR